MADKQTSEASAEPLLDHPAFRQKALYRSWICPGAGFALLGRNGAAWLTYAAVLALLPAMIWIAFQPGAFAAWVGLGVLILALTLSVAEQFACKWATPKPTAPRFLVHRLPIASVLLWAAIGGTLLALFLGFASLQLVGDGMSPTLVKGELFVYSKRPDPSRHQRGAILVYKLPERSAWGQPGWLTVGRILAAPGDRLAIRGVHYLVNGAAGPPVADTRPYAPVVQVPPEPEGITVPEGHYFLVQDDPRLGYDSRVLSWVESRHIVADRMYYLSGSRLLHPVQ